jgi:hypothetical protein
VRTPAIDGEAGVVQTGLAQVRCDTVSPARIQAFAHDDLGVKLRPVFPALHHLGWRRCRHDAVSAGARSLFPYVSDPHQMLRYKLDLFGDLALADDAVQIGPSAGRTARIRQGRPLLPAPLSLGLSLGFALLGRTPLSQGAPRLPFRVGYFYTLGFAPKQLALELRYPMVFLRELRPQRAHHRA